MLKNSYQGAIADWQVRLIAARARKFGFRGPDLEDAEQQIALELLAFRFDEARSNGATPATAVTSLIDRQLRKMRRSEERFRDRNERIALREEPCCDDLRDSQLTLDVQAAIAALPPFSRKVCSLRQRGLSIREMAQQLGTHWHRVRDEVQRIREHFSRLGLHGWIVPEAAEDIAREAKT
jgi:RNA polymerase sigma factor (sigma-70 family)